MLREMEGGEKGTSEPKKLTSTLICACSSLPRSSVDHVSGDRDSLVVLRLVIDSRTPVNSIYFDSCLSIFSSIEHAP